MDRSSIKRICFTVALVCLSAIVLSAIYLIYLIQALELPL